MTPDELRHQDCPVEIRWRQFAKRPEATPGLFCSCHNKWVRWLQISDAHYLIENDLVPVKTDQNHPI